MADTSKTISIKYQAEVQNLVKGLTKVGNVSEKEAQKIIKNLEKAYRKAERDSKRAAEKQERDLKKVAQQSKKTGSIMNASTRNIAIGFAAAGAAVFAFQQNIADASNQLVDASTKTGVAVDTLSGLRLAAEGSGLSFENLEAGLIKLPKLMTDAANGSKRASASFDSLGVSVTTTDGELRSADDVLKDVFHSLQNIESAEQKAAKAAEIFGMRAGPAFIQSGAIDNLESFMDLANEFGVSTGPKMQEEMAKWQRVSATAFSTAQGELSRLLDTFTGAQEGGGLSSIVQFATESFLFFGTVVSDVFKGVVKSVQFGGSLAGAAIEGLKGNWSEAMVALREDAQRARKEGIDDMLSTFERGTQRINKFRTALTKTTETVDKPVGSGGGGGDGETGPTEEEKKALAIAKETSSLQTFILSQIKSREQATQKLVMQEANLLEGVEREKALLAANVAEIERQKQAYIDRTSEIIDGLTDVEGKEAEIMQIFEEHNARKKQFEEELTNTRLEGAAKIAKAEKEAAEEKKKREEEEAEREKRKQQQKMDDIAAQTAMFATVANEFTNLGELSVQLFERFGDENKKNAEIAFNVRKGIAISEVAINTATAITRALAELGPVAGGLASAAITATGAAQIALIASEEPKFHMGGMIGGSSLAPDESRIIAKSGEAVLSSGTVQRLGGESGVNALENGGAMNPVVVVTNPFKHYDRFVKGRRLMGLESQRTGRGGY